MKWEKCILINSIAVGYDALSNEISEDKEVQTVFCRFTPFTETDLNLEGRTVTKNSHKVLIRKPLSAVLPCGKMSIGGMQYRITEKMSAGRFSLFYAERTGADDV